MSTPQSPIEICELSVHDADKVFDWVSRLLTELGEEGEELGTRNVADVKARWRENEARICTLAACDVGGQILGVLTLVEAFAIYANGNYGIINEMYVAPECRSAGVGARLLNAAKAIGRSRGWARIDVTAPESPRWSRTRAFYETNGFVFTGPKLKFILA